jgi:lipase maturation factor 1
LFFLPWRFRRIALFGTVALQLLILATGSYGFFNLLTLVLCVGLCEFPTRSGPAVPWRRFLRWGFVGVVVVVSLNEAAERFVEETPLSRVTTALAPFQSINSYGLFAVMTTERNEITLQGSNDGHNWSTYEFLYKPGDLDRWPRFTGAHMPRLDWQMWFAALGQCGHNRWLLAMMRKLLVDPVTISGLLRENPFGEKPPRYLRTTIRPYFFTALGDPNVWRDEKSQPYCPAVMLEGDDLVEAKHSEE